MLLTMATLNTVNHNSLLPKLNRYGIRGVVLIGLKTISVTELSIQPSVIKDLKSRLISMTARLHLRTLIISHIHK